MGICNHEQLDEQLQKLLNGHSDYDDVTIVDVFYITNRHDETKGIAVLSQNDDEPDDLELEFMCGRGYGRELMNHVKSYARFYGAKRITLTAANNSERFYRKHGFVNGDFNRRMVYYV